MKNSSLTARGRKVGKYTIHRFYEIRCEDGCVLTHAMSMDEALELIREHNRKEKEQELTARREG